MIRASITPGMARTRFSRSSESMVAPTILCRRSECRGSTVGAGLRIPCFPGRSPRSTGSRENPDLSADNLDPEHLVTTGQGLPRREPEHLPGRSPDLDLLTVLIPKGRHHSFPRSSLISRQKTTFLAGKEAAAMERMMTAFWDEDRQEVQVRRPSGQVFRFSGRQAVAGGHEVFGIQVVGTEIWVLTGASGSRRPTWKVRYTQTGTYRGTSAL